MHTLHPLYLWMDGWLFWTFRLFEDSALGFASGLLALGVVCVVAGELSMALAWRLNRGHAMKLRQEMVQRHNLSQEALLEGNKEAYLACNKLANEAYGRYFFTGATLFAASVWPVPFGLGWLDFHFAGVRDLTFPGLGQVTPTFYFLPAYIGLRLCFGALSRHLPLFAWLRRLREEDDAAVEQLKTVMAMAAELRDGSEADQSGAAAAEPEPEACAPGG